MKYIRKTIEVLFPVAAVTLVVFQVIVSNELAGLGKRLGQLESSVRVEQDIKEALEIHVASASSLLTLRERAMALGFMEPTAKQILNLSLESPVALRP